MVCKSRGFPNRITVDVRYDSSLQLCSIVATYVQEAVRFWRLSLHSSTSWWSIKYLRTCNYRVCRLTGIDFVGYKPENNTECESGWLTFHELWEAGCGGGGVGGDRSKCHLTVSSLKNQYSRSRCDIGPWPDSRTFGRQYSWYFDSLYLVDLP